MIGTTAAAILAPIGVVAGLTYVTVAPANNFWGRVICRGPAGSRRVALTFDDGPTPGTTDAILDALRDAGVAASFFVIGANVRRHPDLLRRAHDEGHLVANHSLSHSHYGVCRRRPYWEREIRATDEAIDAVIGVRPAMYRPPCGVKTWHTFNAIARTGHTMVNWSRRAVDGLPTTPQRMMRRFEHLADGDILLLHDGVEPNTRYADRSATIACVPMLIERLRRENLTPVRLDELLGVAGYQSAGVAAGLVGSAM
jgi:peptidoglycan/xylan/chitin deacetylase (PgdA/CDA1 family)